MMHVLRIFVMSGAVAVAMAVTALPAGAAPTDDTATTFEVLAGTLDIVTPETADLGTGAPGTDINGALGVVTVTDGRASADASWAATVTATNLQTGGGSPPELVLATEVDYWSGPATATTGTGTFTPGQATAGGATPLDNVAPLPAFTHAGGTGNNTASWNPGLVVHLPLDSQSGVYSGTVTHSVA
jgi:hypothetical protein